MRADPPRLATLLLGALLPGALRDPILGDLAEEWAERRTDRGRLRADLWYWTRLLSLRPLRLRRALRPVRQHWLPGPGALLRSVPLRPLETLVHDLPVILRRLARSPVFTLAAIVSLALGIGANTAVFSVANALLLSDGGIREPERVVQVFRNSGGPYWRVTWEDRRRMDEQLGDLFSHTTTYRETGVRLSDEDRVTAALLVSGDYFGVVGVQPALGRAFVPGEETDAAGSADVVVLSHDLWRERFGGDPDIVGREIRVNARPTTVVGVLPEGFTPTSTGIPTPVVLPDAQALAMARSDNFRAAARLRPGVGLEQAAGGLERVAASYATDPAHTGDPVEFNLLAQTEIGVHPSMDSALLSGAALLFGIMGMVLLIACTNLASFLLARAADRRREFAIRTSLGAGRGRIAGMLVGEALVLGLIGGGVGLLVAFGSLEALRAMQPPIGVEIDLDVPLDARVLGFTVAVSALAGLLFGLFPALQAARAPVARTLRDESGGNTGGRDSWSLRNALVAGQLVFSLVLLMAGGLFLRSLGAASEIDPGFEPERVALVTVDPGTTGYDESASRALYRSLLERARALPGVEGVALGTRIPLELGDLRTGIRRADLPPPSERGYHFAQLVQVTPGYFETLGTDVVRGRAFDATDARDAPAVVVLNEAASRWLWEEGAPVVGESLELSWEEEEARIVGVVADQKTKTLTSDAEPTVYVPLAQRHAGSVKLLARGAGPAGPLVPRLRSLAKEVDPDLYVHGAMTARESMATALFLPRMGGILLGASGALALLLAAIGLYGVVSYSVASREREVGIRLALGGSTGEMVRLMMRRGTRLVAVGLGVGTVLALVAGQAVERFLIGVGGTDLVTLLAVPLLLGAVALLASWVPARRSARVEPMRAMRSE